MDDKKEYVQFDQYQRYMMVSRVIDYWREKEGNRSYRVLELGSNEHKDLEAFLPDDEILYTDLVLTEKMKSDPAFMQADGSDLPFEDGSFDFVVALDVLEHVPAERRKLFFSEASRVAGIAAILAFPYQAPYVQDAETRVNGYYKAITGDEFIWLKEHRENGLPDLKQVEATLDDLRLNSVRFFHGDINIWEKMWYCHFRGTREYCRLLDRFYNHNLYRQDISETCYRVFYVISHEALEAFEPYISTLWESKTEETYHLLSVLFQAQEQQVRVNQLEARNCELGKAAETQREYINQLEVQNGELGKTAEAQREHISQLEALNGELGKTAEAQREHINQLEVQNGELGKAAEVHLEHINQLEVQNGELGKTAEAQRKYINQLEALNRNLSESFDIISNSTCWRITKPVRVVLDTVKALPYKGKAYILLAKKAAFIMRTQGFKAFLEKYRQRRLRLREVYNLTGSVRVIRNSFVDHAGEEQEPVIPQEWLDIQRQKPLISIVIAAKRLDVRAPYLKKALASLCAQRYQNLEVIVVADAADMPFVQELIRSFDAQITLRSVMLECEAQNRWAYWSEGVSAASGDLIGFLEQEDTLTPNCLAYVLEAYHESTVRNWELYLIPDESQTKDDETHFKDWKSGAGWQCGGADGLLHFGVFDKRRFQSDQAAFEQWLLSLKPEQIFVAPWVGCLEAAIENLWGDNPVRCLAFYLPQFHEIPENNRWWGEGFTEWVNVRKAEPLYQGHHQPRIPGELGYYDLGGAEGAEIQKKQIALAREYGLAGFCYYYYWFDDGKRLLEMPLDRHLHDKTMDFPFCLCWANENWTRQWDGLQSEILMPQTYQPGWAAQFILDLLPYLKDERYIRVNGAPFLLIYNLQDIPNPSEAINTWRAVAEQNGIERLHISAVRRTMEAGELELSGHSLDSLTDFPPHLLGLVNIDHDEDVRFRLPHGQVKDYRKAASFCAEIPKQNYTYFRTAMLEWDNTARRGKKAYIFDDFSLKEYQKWLYAAKRYTLRQNRPGEDLVFINAWNEWAEGTYLEPSEPWGRAALESTKEALEWR